MLRIAAAAAGGAEHANPPLGKKPAVAALVTPVVGAFDTCAGGKKKPTAECAAITRAKKGRYVRAEIFEAAIEDIGAAVGRFSPTNSCTNVYQQIRSNWCEVGFAVNRNIDVMIHDACVSIFDLYIYPSRGGYLPPIELQSACQNNSD